MVTAIASYFNFRQLRTNFKKEIIGGVATFLAVAYIITTQMNILGDSPSVHHQQMMSKGGIFVAMIVVAVIGCGTTAFLGKSPVVLLPGIGVSAIFAYNIAQKNDIGFEGALIAVMFSTILLTVITVSNIRQFILKSIPQSLKTIIAIGIGFFLAYIGLRDIGFVQSDHGIPKAKINDWTQPANYSRILVGLFVFGLVLCGYFFKIKGPVIIALLAGLVVSVLIGNLVHNGDVTTYFARWNGWNYQDLNGFSSNISSTFRYFAKPVVWQQPTLYFAILVITLIDFFDVSGTVYAFRHQLQATDDNYNVELNMNVRRVLTADAVGGLANGFIGISNSTVFLESGVGIAEGARSGFSALVVSGGFLLCLPLFPLFNLITTVLTGSILIFVGFLIMHQIKHVAWKEPENVMAGLFMILLAISTFGITLAIAVTFLVFVLVRVLQPKKRHTITVTDGVLCTIFLTFIILNTILTN